MSNTAMTSPLCAIPRRAMPRTVRVGPQKDVLQLRLLLVDLLHRLAADLHARAVATGPRPAAACLGLGLLRLGL